MTQTPLGNRIDELQRENDELHRAVPVTSEELARLRLNDTRYRWLREHGQTQITIGGMRQADCYENEISTIFNAIPSALDEAIDAELAKGTK